jgi:hypothetical protein
MEIFLAFVLFSIFVLGVLCLVVLEYQNQRTKRWQQPLSPQAPPSHVPVVPKPIAKTTTAIPKVTPRPKTVPSYASKSDAVLTSA